MRDSYQKFIGNLVGKKMLITQKDNLGKKFNLKVFGEHNQKNANMVYVLGKKLGIKEEIIINSLESFPGIERRMELISDKNGVKIYDDYAHHPTAIKATLSAIREKYPKNRIWAIVEPHGYDRTHALLKNYDGVFQSADKVIIGPIFKARDNKTFGITPKSVAEASGHPDILTADSFDQIINILKKGIRKDDVILVMGAGKSNLWAKEICNLKI